MTGALPLLVRMEQGKHASIRQLQNDGEVIAQIKRSLEAWRNGDVVSWSDLKAKLELK